MSVMSSTTRVRFPSRRPASPSVSSVFPDRDALTPQCWARTAARCFVPSRSASIREGTQPPRVSRTMTSGDQPEEGIFSASTSDHRSMEAQVTQRQGGRPTGAGGPDLEMKALEGPSASSPGGNISSRVRRFR